MLNVRRRLDDQQGTLMVGVAVMAAMLLLSAAVVNRTTSNLDNVRQTQDYSSALATADAGVADALFRLDQGLTTSFTGTGTAGDDTFTYSATRINQNKWTIRSRGEVAGVPHTVQADATRDAEYPYALFTEQGLTFHGNGGANITSYDSLTGATDTGNAFIGSNHSITINGGGGGDGQHYYTPAGSCSGCANPMQRPGPRKNKEPVPPVTSQPCPPDGEFGVLDDGVVEINGGGGVPFNCANRDVSFLVPTTCVDDTDDDNDGIADVADSDDDNDGRLDGGDDGVPDDDNDNDGVLNAADPDDDDGGCRSIRIVNGPVIIYVDGNDRIIDLAEVSINLGGRSADLQILMAGTGAIDVGNGSHVGDFTGILYAPKADMVVNGGQLSVNGTMTLNSLTVNGNPNFDLRYDDSLIEIVSTSWVVVDYQEVPSSAGP